MVTTSPKPRPRARRCPDGWTRLGRFERRLPDPGPAESWENPSRPVASITSVFAVPGLRLGISVSRKMLSHARRTQKPYHRFDNLDSFSFTRTSAHRIRVVRVSGSGKNRNLSGIGVPVGIDLARRHLAEHGVELDDLLDEVFGARLGSLFPLLCDHPHLRHPMLPGPLANAPDLATGTAALFGASRAAALGDVLAEADVARIHAAVAVRDRMDLGEMVEYLRHGPVPAGSLVPWTARKLRPVLARTGPDTARALVYALARTEVHDIDAVQTAIRLAQTTKPLRLSGALDWEDVADRLRAAQEFDTQGSGPGA